MPAQKVRVGRASAVWCLPNHPARNQSGSVRPNRGARIYAALGENDLAFERLDTAYNERSPEIVSLKADPSFNNLHGDQRFQDLLVRVGLA